jgi:hypothetical protein
MCARADIGAAVLSYRPIADVWILARSKVKYFGAYPAGFLSRARDLLGVGLKDQVLHVCSGKVREYPFKGVGQYDVTMDMNPMLAPTFYANAADPDSYAMAIRECPQIQAVLADPPYTPEFAAHYEPGAEYFVTADEIVKHSINILPIGGRVGVLSLHWPRYPKKLARQIAVVAVYVGNGNLGRTFAVFERIA